jgi:CrcB protein
MVSFFMVFIGGGLGSLCRYATGLLAKMLFGNVFPLGTLFVNLIGCFAIGYLSARFERIFATQETRDLCIAGMLGGFTTFSAFGLETMNLFKNGSNMAAILNILLNVILGILLAYAGFYLGRK